MIDLEGIAPLNSHPRGARSTGGEGRGKLPDGATADRQPGSRRPARAEPRKSTPQRRRHEFNMEPGTEGSEEDRKRNCRAAVRVPACRWQALSRRLPTMTIDFHAM
ncbi:hypothetical protein HAX54_039140 [Datura stramonium]|uniref:Uncharacterized protein n=1 Tax=Datura stramonium TaxID=4076 RepID=A0ABS8RNJ2_DATST|nr:hypothetical protein [Datura stramonium]